MNSSGRMSARCDKKVDEYFKLRDKMTEAEYIRRNGQLSDYFERMDEEDVREIKRSDGWYSVMPDISDILDKEKKFEKLCSEASCSVVSTFDGIRCVDTEPDKCRDLATKTVCNSVPDPGFFNEKANESYKCAWSSNVRDYGACRAKIGNDGKRIDEPIGDGPVEEGAVDNFCSRLTFSDSLQDFLRRTCGAETNCKYDYSKNVCAGRFELSDLKKDDNGWYFESYKEGGGGFEKEKNYIEKDYEEAKKIVEEQDKSCREIEAPKDQLSDKKKCDYFSTQCYWEDFRKSFFDCKLINSQGKCEEKALCEFKNNKCDFKSGSERDLITICNNIKDKGICEFNPSCYGNIIKCGASEVFRCGVIDYKKSCESFKNKNDCEQASIIKAAKGLGGCYIHTDSNYQFEKCGDSPQGRVSSRL